MNKTIVETFVGCGGAHIGFTNKGFETLLVNDIDEDMINTLLANNVIESNQYFKGSIIDMTNNIIDSFIPKGKDVDVLFGGIVCKGFSLAGVRNPFDARNYLYQEQLRIVEHLRPKVSVIENVVGLREMVLYWKNDVTKDTFQKYTELSDKNKNLNGEKSARRKNNQEYTDISKTIEKNKKEMEKLLENVSEHKFKILDKIENEYKRLGYRCYVQVLKASDYECYTSRCRLIIVAVRNDITKEYKFPTKVEGSFTLENALNLIDYEGQNNPSIDIDNQPMKHNIKTVERFKRIPEGKNIADIVDELPNDLKISKFYSRGNTQRLDRKKPVPTLVPGHSNFPIHPFEHRSITVREAATITGFPLNYKFCGSHSARCMQIGNAVPVQLAEHIAQSILDVLS
jgi:DNA (cytosine-5)-methyltransferase 1